MGVVPSPGERGAVSESMNRDLNRVNVGIFTAYVHIPIKGFIL